MTIKINFDVAHNPEEPTLILARRNGDKLGKLNAKSIEVTDSLNDASEISFTVYKYIEDKIDILWQDIVNFKLVYCVEWNTWFEMTVETNEADETIKTVFCKRLGQAELGQIMLYNIEINTENDIAREDYDIDYPTVLFREITEDDTVEISKKKKNSSLLNRIMEKAPHYSVIHVDDTIKNIQRIFSFDDTSIWDAFQEIGEEIGCLFVAHSNSDEFGNIQRTISVYDLQSTCLNPDCSYKKKHDIAYRGEFTSECPECGSKLISEGFGNDTTIFVSSDMLANDIQFTTDTDSVKNCFKLQAGDDLMTATIRNCNPNGTDYIWYISEDTKADMSKGLFDKLDEYNVLYKKEYEKDISIDIEVVDKKGNIVKVIDEYNKLVDKYMYDYNLNSSVCFDCGYRGDFGIKTTCPNPDCGSDNVLLGNSLQRLENPLNGYPELMIAHYNAIDFEYYLRDSRMPYVDISVTETTAEEQLKKITDSISPVSVNSISTMSVFTATNAVSLMSKTYIDPRYVVEIDSEVATLEEGMGYLIWKGVFNVKSKIDKAREKEDGYVPTDSVQSIVTEVIINDNYKNFVTQKMEKALSKEDLNIVDLFKKSNNEFALELEKYSLNYLKNFENSCQTCLDILTEQGVGNEETWSGQEPNLYNDLYLSYDGKMSAIKSEINIRQEEIDWIVGIYDSDGNLKTHGMQSAIIEERNKIQDNLNFEKYLGEELWLELSSYRREDKYENSNYISDGYTNAELFKLANEFIQVAEKELYKSSELQHSISTSLKNLLVMKEFEPLVKDFQIGNWIRVLVDDKVYKLRLINYSINYDDLDDISVEFSDVDKPNSSVNSIQSIIAQASSMSTSYNTVQRQAQQGVKSNTVINGWFENGLDITNTEIIGGADNQTQTWSEHGMLFREYDEIEDKYNDTQLKIINSTLAITDDNWKTVKTAVGAYYYFDPLTGKLNKAYGVNAETIVGKLLIGEGLTIANKSNTFIVDDNGATLVNANFSMETANGNSKIILNPEEGIKIQGVTNGVLQDKFYVDENGNVMIKGALTSGSTVTGATIVSGNLNIGDGSFVVDNFGNLNIGKGKFVVDNNGDVNIGNGALSFDTETGDLSIKGKIVSGSTINDSTIVGGSLNIGNGAFVVDNKGNVTIKSGSISWGAVTGTDAIDKAISDAQAAAINAQTTANTANSKAVSAYNLAGEAVDLADAAGDDIVLLAKGEYTKAGSTFISGTNVYSPNISSPSITGGTITGTTIISTSGNKKATLTNSKLTFRVEGSYSYDVGYIQAYDDGDGTSSSAGHGLRIRGLWNGDGWNGGIQIQSSDYAGISLYAGSDIFFWVDKGATKTSVLDILDRIENASGSGTAVFG